MLIHPGSVLKGRYRIDALSGRGGMVMVYRAFDLNLQRVCAIKQNLDISPQAQRQFHTEAVLLANLNHPHLARVTDHFLDTSGQQYLVMDFVEGENLEDFVARHGPLSEAQALSWMRGVLDAVAYCHSQGVVHRDIKPANLIKRHGRNEVVLVDFGIARRQATGMVTAAGAKAATPAYAPPEQFSGHTDTRSDVYSLGATLYFLLTGQMPPDARLMAAGIESLVPPRRYSRQISSKTERAILRAMAVRVPDRPQSVAELQALLAAARPAVQPGGRQRRLALLTGLPILVVALTIVGLLLSGGVGTGTITPTTGALAVAAGANSVIAVTTHAPTMTTTGPSATPLETSASSVSVPGQRKRPAPTGTAASSRAPTSTPIMPTATLSPRPTSTLVPIFLRTEQREQPEREWTFDAGDNRNLTLVYDQLPNVFRIPGAMYFWKVAVVQASSGQRLSRSSEEWRFVFKRQDEASPPTGTPMPTRTPSPSLTATPGKSNQGSATALPETPTRQEGGASCPPYLHNLHKPKPGMGLLLIENHIGEPLHIDRVGTTEKWDLPPKQGDTPSRLLLDLPPGFHEFLDHTPWGYGHIGVTIRAGEAWVSPIWYNGQAEEKIFPLQIPDGCQ